MANTRWAALACILLRAACGQSTDATVSGTVTDPSGANVAGANVVALNIETGVATTTQTNSAGVYIFAALPPGAYRISAEHAGFRKALITDITLEVGARLTYNLALEIGSTTETVEVQAGAAGDLAYATASVGNVVSGRKILELPLAGRSTYDLITTQAGVVGANISGNRTGSLNVTTDGINTQDNLLNNLFNIGVANQIRVDRVEEFRIVTSPTDVELGRGSGQIQVITRSGTNTFHGSLYHEHRNTVLTANSFFNNARGNDPVTGQQISPRDRLIRNQYGGRLSGPVKRNRTFFSGNYEGEKTRQKVATTATVYTATARQGLFRYFPGVQNGNADARVPTVDLSGNPVRPAGAAGDLQSVTVFGRDAARMAADSTGVIAKQLGLMPLPNNFRAGDGLNTAGYTWRRPVTYDFETFETRVDHLFSPNHRMSVSFNHQAYASLNVAGPQPLPAAPGGTAPTETTSYVASFTSVIRPNLLNEFRAGVFRPRTQIVAPYDPANNGEGVLSRAGEQPYLIALTGNVTTPLAPTNYGSDNSGRISPVYQWGDNVSWLKGRHSFKGGVEIRFVSSAGFDAFAVTPRATVGAGFVPVTNINTIAGIGQNTGGAQNLLLDLNGSLSNAFQVHNSPGGANPVFLPGQTRYRNWSQHEYSYYFKDEIKVNPSLTLNIGIRYEWYAAPHERQGKALALKGGTAGLFGISGSSFADIFQPNRQAGALTQVQLVGPGTPNADVKLYQNDNNNFAPGVGLAWSLPWFGKDKTVIRTGYGIGYERNPIYLTHNVSGLEPGLSQTAILLVPSVFNVRNLRLPVAPTGPPLSPIPVTERTQNIFAFDDNLRTPYIQNWNFSITRSLPGSGSFTARYVGSKGTKLVRAANINEVNIFENGLLEAFRITQAGGNAPLLNQIFMGLGGVNGTTVTGSDLVRTSTATQGFFSNNDPGGFAAFISGTNQLTGVNGGLLRRVGLPENFVVANPQVAQAQLTSNFSNSSYHSMQLEYMKRFSAGWTAQSNYTWSKTLGDYDGEDSALQSNYRTLRNRNLDKVRLGYDRRHVFRTNGIYELPFGPGKTIGRNTSGVLGRVIGGWQTGGIFNAFSGSPIGYGAVGAVNTAGGGTPIVSGPLPVGSVQRTGQGVVWFSGLQQVVDPYVANITTLQGIQGRSTMRAIADAGGKVLLSNPAPGQFGTLVPRVQDGPGAFRLDVNVIKRIKLTERIEAYVRADAINVTNSPQFGNPDLNINSLNFGRITGTTGFGEIAAGGARLVVLQARVTF